MSREQRKTVLRGSGLVVIDVDENVLDNSPYQARLVRDGDDYNEAT